MKSKLKEMIKEHKRLIHVLRSKSRKDDKVEAKKQSKELKEYESRLGKAIEACRSLLKAEKPFEGYNKNRHARSGGLNAKFRAKYNRKHGSNLKAPVTEKNPTGKKKARKKSFCARMRNVKGPMRKEGKPTPKAMALRRWKCR